MTAIQDFSRKKRFPGIEINSSSKIQFNFPWNFQNVYAVSPVSESDIGYVRKFVISSLQKKNEKFHCQIAESRDLNIISYKVLNTKFLNITCLPINQRL